MIHALNPCIKVICSCLDEVVVSFRLSSFDCRGLQYDYGDEAGCHHGSTIENAD